MQKKITLVTALLCAVLSFAQKVYPVAANSGELYGYASFNMLSPKVANKIYFGINPYKDAKYQLVLQDVNLNTINDVLLDYKVPVYDFGVTYNKTHILVRGKVLNSKGGSDTVLYYMYDLAGNKLSALQSIPLTFDKKEHLAHILPLDGKGFLFLIGNSKQNQYRVLAVDNSNKKLWSTTLNNIEKGKERDMLMDDISIEENQLVATFVDNADSKKAKYSLMAMDTRDGKEIFRQTLDDANYRYESNNVQVKNDKIYVFGDLYDEGKKFNGINTGIFMITTDKTGKNTVKKNLQWTDLKNKLDINEKGWVDKTGYIFTHNFVIDDASKHILVPGEFFKGNLTGVTVSDMVFLDFDPDFKLANVKVFDKKETQFQLESIKLNSSRIFGKTLKDYGYFDYMFHNKLDKNRGLAFYYLDVDRNLGLFRKGEYSYGTIAYVNGQFTENKIRFTSKNPVGLLPSKPGYIMLHEYTAENGMEKRIEKINY